MPPGVIGRLLIATAVAALGSPAAGSSQLVARAPTGVTPEAERLLAATAKPWELELARGEDLMSAARQLCGRLTPTYTEILLQANSGRGDSTKVIVPACFVTRLDARVKVQPGESLTAVANRHAGIAGPRTIARLFGSNKALARAYSETIAQSTVPADVRVLTVPVATEPVIFELKPGQDALSVSRQLATALGISSAVENGPAPADEFILEADVVAGLASPVDCAGSGASKYVAWPYSVADVAAALARIDSERARLGLGPVDASVVAVLDNGMDGIFSSHFPQLDFEISTLELARPDLIDPDGSGYDDDVVGTNIFSGGQPVAFANAPKGNHGTIMASLALGGPQFRSWQATNLPGRRVKIRAVSMLQRTVEASDRGNVTRFRMPTDSLANALQYALRGKSKTVNLSVSTRNRLQSAENALFNHDDLLVIVAAGNFAYELDIDSRYPASLSPVHRPNGGRVITVAAHDRRGCLSTFSGRGKETVDIASPGEEIEATTIGGQQIVAKGTSQATAITSFAAALVRQAADLSPALVKDRLIASVDLSPDLAPYVRSEGTLNVGKALSVYHDVLELDQPPTRALIGFLNSAAAPGLFCPQLAGDTRQVMKVSRRVDGGDHRKVRVLLRNLKKEGELKVVYCAPTDATLSFTAATGEKTEFKLAEVVDYVPRN